MHEEVVYAIHDFVAENEDEIAFQTGDAIVVLEKDDKYMDGWWQGRNAQGHVGLFPINYATIVKPTPSPSNSTAPTSNSSRSCPQEEYSLEDEINDTINQVHATTTTSVATATASDKYPLPHLQSPPPPPPLPSAGITLPEKPEHWSVDQVADWLQSVGLSNVVSQFVEQEISGDILMELTSDALKELGIVAYGRRYKIMHAIEGLKSDTRPTPPVSPSSAAESTNGESLYQFPRKAPAPPHDSFLAISPSSSSSMSRSNTFRTISSKISSSSSHSGNPPEKASYHKASFENTAITDATPYPPPPPPPPVLRESLSADDLSQDRTLSTALRPNGSTALVRASADAFSAPDHEGWLHKQGDKYRTWNKRWFVLKGPNLFYFKSPKDTRMRGIIHLRGYRVVADESIHSGKYSFKAQHEHERTFYFYTDSKESMRTWLKALMKATITRDFTAPVMSSSHVTTVTLDVARQLRPRPPSKMLSNGQHHMLLPSSSPPPLPYQPELSSMLETVLSDDDEDLIDPMRQPQQQPQQQEPPQPQQKHIAPSAGKFATSEQYIEWINRHLPPGHQADNLTQTFRNGDALICLLESLSKKSVRRQPIQHSESANMVALDNMVAAFKFMGREGVVVDGNYTIKDVFAGHEEKIMNMLDAIISWSEKNGFTATV